MLTRYLVLSLFALSASVATAATLGKRIYFDPSSGHGPVELELLEGGRGRIVTMDGNAQITWLEHDRVLQVSVIGDNLKSIGYPLRNIGGIAQQVEAHRTLISLLISEKPEGFSLSHTYDTLIKYWDRDTGQEFEIHDPPEVLTATGFKVMDRSDGGFFVRAGDSFTLPALRGPEVGFPEDILVTLTSSSEGQVILGGNGNKDQNFRWSLSADYTTLNLEFENGARIAYRIARQNDGRGTVLIGNANLETSEALVQGYFLINENPSPSTINESFIVGEFNMDLGDQDPNPIKFVADHIAEYDLGENGIMFLVWSIDANGDLFLNAYRMKGERHLPLTTREEIQLCLSRPEICEVHTSRRFKLLQVRGDTLVMLRNFTFMDATGETSDATNITFLTKVK